MEKEVRLTNTTLVVTLKCNLNCKLCAVSAPYYKNPPSYAIEDLKKSIDRYFEAVDYIEKFTVNGGEPFLYPDIDKVIVHLLQYEEKIGMLEIITNSTVTPSDKLVSALMRSDKVDILLDDYGMSLSKGIQKTIDIFEQEHIKYRHRIYYGRDAHLGGWVDLRDLSKKERSAKETESIYKNCAYPGPFHCFVLFGGKAYICGVYARCIEEGIIPKREDETVDFLKENWDVEEARRNILSFYDRTYFSACEYCNGFCMDAKRYEPAEQLTAEELHWIKCGQEERA